MAMAENVDRNPAGKVEQLTTALIPYSRTRAAHRNKTSRGIVGNHYLIKIGACYGGMLNGHCNSPEREHRPVMAGDGRIVGAVLTLALPPCDNFLQSQPTPCRCLHGCDTKHRQ